MNGTSRSPTTIAPFASPAKVEARIPAPTASNGASVGCNVAYATACPSGPVTSMFITYATVTTDNAMSEPADKSIPAAMMIKVMPNPAVAYTHDWRRMFSRLRSV